MNGGACSHHNHRPSFPGPRLVILREREAAFPACDSGARHPYRSIPPVPKLGKWWLLAFAGKVEYGSVRANSATDSPISSFEGVNRMAWILFASGPESTVAIPEICPRPLILLAAF